MRPPPCFIVCCWWYPAFGSCQTCSLKLNFGLKRWQELFSCLQSLPHAFWQTSFLVATWHVFNNGFSLPLSNKTVTGEAPAQQLLYTASPISVAEAWNSVKDTGLLVASSTSRYSALVFWGWPALRKFTSRPQSNALCISDFFICSYIMNVFSSWFKTDTQYWLTRSWTLLTLWRSTETTWLHYLILFMLYWCSF